MKGVIKSVAIIIKSSKDNAQIETRHSRVEISFCGFHKNVNVSRYLLANIYIYIY